MWHKKFTRLVGHWTANKAFVLDAPFTYISRVGSIVVPKGFVTDFDSVPRLPLAYWLAKGRTRLAPVIHDYLYATHALDGVPISRRFADQLFLEAMVDESVGRAARRMIWAGVRAGGFLAWRSSGRAYANSGESS